MYFEARSYTLLTVANAAQAALLIKTGQASSHEALVWLNSRGERIAVVDDSHIDSRWLEAAVLNLDLELQLESITTGWCDEIAEVREAFVECQDYTTSEDWVTMAKLNIEGSNDDATVQFECSCCGTHFPSTLREQRPHDLDQGFGHCPDCLHRFATA